MSTNVCYIILNILFLMVARIKVNELKLSRNYKLVLLGGYLLFTLFSYSYVSGIMNNIFKLKFLDVKYYLLLLVISNVIMIYSLNKPVKLVYKVINIVLYVSLTIILGATLSVVLGNKINTFYVMDIKNAINFVDLSFVLFIIYLIVVSLIYIGSHIFSSEGFTKENIFKKVSFKDIRESLLNLAVFREVEDDILTPEEILNYRYDDSFNINGVDASIIFEDSVDENIIKNYYILTEDINARLMNGYTLEENKMLKNVCLKLHTGNLKSVDLSNTNIINKISVDEYNLLKRVIES